jgi:hypothetical protein
MAGAVGALTCCCDGFERYKQVQKSARPIASQLRPSPQTPTKRSPPTPLTSALPPLRHTANYISTP